MTDMLVKLYRLPPLEPALARPREAGVAVRRALAAEKHIVLAWIRDHFEEHWVSETDAAFANRPIACFVAVAARELLGFACYDAGLRGMWGPTGVSEAARGKGLGAALLLASLHDMRTQGYGYAVIGWTGPQEFYAKIVGATVIENSRPGVYRGLLGMDAED